MSCFKKRQKTMSSIPSKDKKKKIKNDFTRAVIYLKPLQNNGQDVRGFMYAQLLSSSNICSAPNSKCIKRNDILIGSKKNNQLNMLF
jgi:hypothetical protein